MTKVIIRELYREDQKATVAFQASCCESSERLKANQEPRPGSFMSPELKMM